MSTFPLRLSHLTLSLLITTSLLTIPTHATNLNVTALTHRSGISILQCWSLTSPFQTANSGPTGATVATLGAIGGNASFIVQSPGSVGGFRNAPAPQWSLFISGLAHIALLNSTDEAWIQGGKYGLVYADDTVDVAFGHYTTFPSKEETVLLGLPVEGGRQPEHGVVREGACLWEDLLGI